jgi:flagellar motor switch protein FliN/FliY
VEEFKYNPMTAEEAARAAQSAAQEAAEAAFDAAVDMVSAGVEAAEFGPLELGVDAAAGETRQNLDLLLDVSLPIAVEVGCTQMTLDDVLDLVPGSVITLDKKAEEPVDLRVNGKLVARGEVVLVDDVYGIRITQIVEGGIKRPGHQN